jgi:hypothetical protein
MKQWLILVLTAAFLLSNALMPSTAGGTSVYAELSVSAADPLRPRESWRLEVVAANFVPFENGEIKCLFAKLPNTTLSEEIIWRGKGAVYDTIRAEYELEAPPPGEYVLWVTLTPYPDREKQKLPTRATVFFEVNQDKVYYAPLSPVGIGYQKILEELRERGFSDTTMEGISRDAPDLAERIRGLTSRTAPPGSSTEVRYPSPSTKPHDLDSQNTHPTWGPPRPAYPRDSAEQDDNRANFPPERVKDYRPRHRIDITPSRDTSRQRPVPSSSTPEIPSRDLARDSALYMEPWLIERSNRIRKVMDSTKRTAGQSGAPSP